MRVKAVNNALLAIHVWAAGGGTRRAHQGRRVAERRTRRDQLLERHSSHHARTSSPSACCRARSRAPSGSRCSTRMSASPPASRASRRCRRRCCSSPASSFALRTRCSARKPTTSRRCGSIEQWAGRRDQVTAAAVARTRLRSAARRRTFARTFRRSSACTAAIPSRTSTVRAARRCRASVVDAMRDYLLHHNANSHWAYPTSVETDARHRRARAPRRRFSQRRAERDRVRREHDDAHLLTVARARPDDRAGDEIVVTELDHHANVAPWTRLAAERGA